MQHDPPTPVAGLVERVSLGRLMEREGVPDHRPGVACVDHLHNRPQVRAGREGRVFDRANAALLRQFFGRLLDQRDQRPAALDDSQRAPQGLAPDRVQHKIYILGQLLKGYLHHRLDLEFRRDRA